VRIAAIGPATAASVERRGMRVAARPSEYRAEALLDALGDVGGSRILLARAAVAREILPQELRARGATVDVVAVYRTVAPSRALRAEDLGRCDMVTFTSSSTVTNFMRLLGDGAREVLARSHVAAIGPVTAETLREAGFEADVVPADYTIDALAAAICAFFAKRQGVK